MGRSGKKAGIAAAIGAALAFAAAAPAVAGVTAAEAIAALNAQREANGIPGGIVENRSWSAGCDRHVSYMQRNDVLEHSEDGSLPGASPEGEEAGMSSVLSQGDSWAEGNPWETAPIHLHQLLGPRLSVSGVADRDGWVCMYTWPGYQRPAPADFVTYTYPGPDTTGHRFEETAAERPYTPGSRVGIPEGTKTGPYLYAMFDGPFQYARTTAGSATLTGPGGPVDVAVVGNHTSGIGGYIPAGLEVIPLRRLRARTTYTAAIEATLEGDWEPEGPRAIAHSWSFTTGARPNRVSIDLDRDSRRDSRALVYVGSGAPRAELTLTGPGGVVLRPALRHRRANVQLPAGGRWTACAESGGDGTDWDPASDCASQRFPAPLDLELPRRLSRGKLRLSVPPAAVGRRASVTVLISGGLGRRLSLRLRRKTTIPLPRAGRRDTYNVTLSLRGFTRRGVRYESTLLYRSYRAG